MIWAQIMRVIRMQIAVRVREIRYGMSACDLQVTDETVSYESSQHVQ